MADLIDRQATARRLLNERKHYDCYRDIGIGLDIARMIVEDYCPTAQRTGRWIWDDEGYHCSECFYHAYGNTSEVMMGDFKFCPNCGCAMEGEDE